ncbi:acylphosphatase [Patescibacteria group bacterium]|nr:acylphosphatase [Patescibacteria group bacterium]
MKRARVHVSGRVQGVFYRMNAKKTADSLTLTGWVRNLPDGVVEAVFEGEESKVKKALAWCRRGPENSRVDDVEIGWEKPQGENKTFQIKY